MKKITLALVATFMLIGAQPATAFTRWILSDLYSNEQAAVSEAKQISSEIRTGNNATARTEARSSCRFQGFTAEFSTQGTQIFTIWIENGADMVKKYQAKVGYNVKCDPVY